MIYKISKQNQRDVIAQMLEKFCDYCRKINNCNDIFPSQFADPEGFADLVECVATTNTLIIIVDVSNGEDDGAATLIGHFTEQTIRDENSYHLENLTHYFDGNLTVIPVTE